MRDDLRDDTEYRVVVEFIDGTIKRWRKRSEHHAVKHITDLLEQMNRAGLAPYWDQAFARIETREVGPWIPSAEGPGVIIDRVYIPGTERGATP